jgi:uncharacterized protein YeaO (DUF488 family)
VGQQGTPDEGTSVIYTKRWNDVRELSDGLRVLVTRYRPRALRKEHETWDEWVRDLAPSVELHAAFYGKGCEPISWSAYQVRYRREMREAREHILRLAKHVRAGNAVTLLCSSACTDECRCHRSLLRELIDAELTNRAAGRGSPRQVLVA